MIDSQVGQLMVAIISATQPQISVYQLHFISPSATPVGIVLK